MHREHLLCKEKILGPPELGIDHYSRQMFGAADKATNCRSCYYIRVCQIGVTFTHAARHITVCGGNGHLTFLRTAGTRVDTGAATWLFNQMNACRQQRLVKSAPLRFLTNAFRAVLDEGWDRDAPSAKDLGVHCNRRDIPSCAGTGVRQV